MISFVIPVFNEEDIIIKNITKLIRFLNIYKISNEIICVNDGSTDNSKDILNKIDDIRVVSYHKNMGKGYAIKKGISESNGEIIFFMDADLSTDINHIPFFINKMNNYDLFIGDRSDKKYVLKSQPIYRVLIGKICNKIFKFIFKIDINDTQCGFKIFKKKYVNHENFKTNKYLFDLELILDFLNKKLSVGSSKVKWKNNEFSKLNILKDLPSFLIELLTIIRKF